MLRYYKEMKWVVSLIIIMLDGIIINYFPSYFNSLNYLYPMLTLSLIPFLDDNYQKYYKKIFIIGIIYDLLYSNIFLYHAFIFLLIALINRKILLSFKNNLLLFLIIIPVNIIVYDTINFLVIIFTNYQAVALIDLWYKICHSLLLNILSGFVFFFLFKKKIIDIKLSGDSIEI